jgi:predicted enzyme related to lactoylglutathione lyase
MIIFNKMHLLQISITTNDLEKLKDFYCNVFDFKPYSSWNKPNDGLNAIKLTRNEVLLEITQSSKLIAISAPFSMHKQGLNMIGFIVDDIDETIKIAEANGGKLNQPIIQGLTVKEIAFITDPDGNGIELIRPRFDSIRETNLVIDDYSRSDLWSTGRITTDIQIISKFFRNNLWADNYDAKLIVQALKKVGDICGCPIPDKVALREGEIGAFNYLFGLSHIYNKIKKCLCDNNPSLYKEWGKSEVRDTKNEPAGEDASRIPQELMNQNILRGPGKYQEFSITRLLWIDYIEKDLAKKVGFNEVIPLLKQAKSIDDLQVDILALVANKRINNENQLSLISNLVKGIAHEGFFKQNNCYKQVERVSKLLKKKYSNEKWLNKLSEEVDRILLLPITQYS